MTPLWKHQVDAVQYCQSRDHYALFWEMGCGKTRAQIEILNAKYQMHGELIPTLILCPIVVMENWRREFLEFSKVPAHQIILLEGPSRKRLNTLIQAQTRYGSNFIAITNYETLLMVDVYGALRDVNFKALVCDESHKLKSMKAVRTKKAVLLSKTIKYRFLLSGTPVLNSPMDLFTQYLVMDGGEQFGKNFYGFRARFFYDANQYMPAQFKFPDWRVKEGAIERINKVVKETSMRVTKEECLDLPPLVRQTRQCLMTPDQSRMYKQMEKDFVTYLADKACVAQLALTKALRLQQIVSGFVKMEDGVEVSLPATPREEALEELLEELTPNHKVIIWAVFKHNYQQIRKILERQKIKYAEVHGEIAQKDKQLAIDNFQRDAETRVYLGHPGSGGIGVNLTVSDYSIYFSRDFSLEHDLQSEARNHRGGSERHQKITRIDLVTPETIDELVLQSLAKKEELGESLLSKIRGKFHG